MPSLSDLLKSKISSAGLTVAKAADKVGVSIPSMRSAVAGSAAPNARSIGKYASFLGIGKADAIALVAANKKGGKGGRKRAAKKAGKKTGTKKAGKKTGKRGRPAGKRGRPPGKRGRPPGKRGRPAASGVSTGRVNAALARVSKSLKRAEKYLSGVLKSLR
ncbi:MAG: hypothetical protein H0W83_02745 [Planctomycetes bacterium]|nr:hypothetical protein [Planctomycetota bacterium]